MLIAIDFGISNTDIVVNDKGAYKFFSHPTDEKINERFLEKIFSYIDIPADKFSLIGVTGGKSSDLSDEYQNVKVLKVNDSWEIKNNLYKNRWSSNVGYSFIIANYTCFYFKSWNWDSNKGYFLIC